MPSNDNGGQPNQPNVSAGQDALVAGRDITVNQLAQNGPSGSWTGEGVLAPPLGDLPLELRGRDDLIDQLQQLLLTRTAGRTRLWGSAVPASRLSR
jgi:hypothetical protein